MNRAKSFCKGLSESELYTVFEKEDSTEISGPFQGLTDIIKKEIKIQKMGLGLNHKVDGKIISNVRYSSRKRYTQKQVIGINMGQYLNAFEKHSQEFLPEWYEKADHGIFSLVV